MASGVFGGECIGVHTVFIFDRGGVTRVAQLLDISELEWTRDRDGISEARIRIEGAACSAQAAVLAAIEPKRSEVVIFRGNDRVWEGPVWRVGWFSDHVEIDAHDVFQYVMETPLTQAYSNAYPNVGLVSDRIEAILDHEMAVWEALTPPINVLEHLTIHHFPNEAKTTSVTKPFEMTVGEHIQHLAHYSGIDFACIGRAIHIWDVSRALGKTRSLTEADFLSEVIVTAYGSEMTSAVYVIGEDGVYGEAHEPNSYYGPWTKILTAYNEEGTEAPTQEELNSQAERNLHGRMPVPIEVRVPDGSGIRLNDTLTIHDLVPGVQVPLLATLNARQVSQMQRIDHVRVAEKSTGETVQVTLTPTATSDDDTPDR
jgi:hypothetical protein